MIHDFNNYKLAKRYIKEADGILTNIKISINLLTQYQNHPTVNKALKELLVAKNVAIANRAKCIKLITSKGEIKQMSKRE